MKYREKKILNYKPEQLFDLVSDIKKYPEFLPWCLGSRVKKISHKQLNADLIVGMRIYREIFKSNVHLNKASSTIEVEYLKGPFKQLKNKWIFKVFAISAMLSCSQVASKINKKSIKNHCKIHSLFRSIF